MRRPGRFRGLWFCCLTAALVPGWRAKADEISYLTGVGAGLDGGWVTTVHSLPRQAAPQPQVADPAWTTVVYARRTATVASAAVAPGPRLTGTPHALSGVASYYWEDQLTASGEVFDKHAMTAAHPSLPLGTKVRVTNLGNGRSAIVRINDRGPYVPGRIIDVSEAAADVLGMRDSGLAPVKVDLVSN